MNAENSIIPTEAIALVHHIELNKAGWWNKTVQRLITATIWLSGQPRSADEIRQGLETSFRLTLPIEKIEAQVREMENKGSLVELPDGRFRIPDERRKKFEAEIGEAEEVERKARDFFNDVFSEISQEDNTDDLWNRFNQLLLGPLVKQVGVSAYRLLAGERMEVDKKLEQRFLNTIPAEQASNARKSVGEFLDPKKPEVCAYIGRMLHARFCVEASGLSDAVLMKLNASLGRQIRFRMFVDTNFLFSLMELHENPSNAAALELQELLEKLNSNPKVDLVVTPETIEEAKSSISYTKSRLNGLPAGANFTEAALRANFSGMAIRFLNQRLVKNGSLSPEDWFDPYMNDFVRLARGKGVELHNEKMDEYSTRQDVVDDIHLVLNSEKRLPPERRKSYEKIAHDMKLWHFVNDKRPAYSESPIDVKDWILTVDFRLINFDGHKQKKAAGQFPVCLHPTPFIQLLQFWVPRSPDFEEAMLGSLRLPFLFEEFDVEGEKTSLKILKGIGRYEGSEGLSSQTITHVMLNDGLRARLQTGHSEDEELQIIRDALVEEMKAKADAEAERAQQLSSDLQQSRSKVTILDSEAKNKDKEIELLKTRISEEEEKVKNAELSLLEQGKQIAGLKQKWDEQEAKSSRMRSLVVYLGILFFVLSAAFASAWFIPTLLPDVVSIIGIKWAKLLLGVVFFIFFHLILEWTVGRRALMKELWPFRQVCRFRGWLWTLVILGFVLGVFGNLVANQIQQNLDNNKISPSDLTKPTEEL